jgi:hypothetical protein
MSRECYSAKSVNHSSDRWLTKDSSTANLWLTGAIKDDWMTPVFPASSLAICGTLQRDRAA